MNKAQLKEIRAWAAQLPPIKQQCISGYTVSYRPATLGGREERVINPHVYTVNVNHARRIKRAFKRNGNDGVAHYIASVAILMNKQRQGDKVKK